MTVSTRTVSVVCTFRAALVTLIAVGMLAACGPAAVDDGIDPTDAQQVARGEAIYRQRCAACHGAQLEGQPDWRRRLPNGRLPAPPHDESGHTWHHPNDDLVAMTRDGMVPPLAPPGYESDMPAFGGVVDDADIRAVIAYIQSTWSDEVMAVRRRMLEQAAR
ncbi:MAG TPA: c-type cytochrome [Rhodocyclaceae bacterium]|nr:c-type cytochrome [Rhodocyclaceae bacterium]